MNTNSIWNPALEIIAALPRVLGYHPQESVVVVALDLGPTELTLGPNARLDVGALLHEPGMVEFAVERLWLTDCDSVGVVCWTREADPADLAERLSRVSAFDLFEGHVGFYVVTPERIHGFGFTGTPMGVRDLMELGLTGVAMAAGADSLPASQHDLAPRRLPTEHDPARQEWCPEQPAWSRLVEACRAGEWDGTTSDAFGVGQQLARQEFRDAFLAWVLAEGPEVGNHHAVPTTEWMEGTSEARPTALLRDSVRVLRSVAEPLPRGEAAPALATAGYLAWWSGDGLLARLFTTAALQEDPTYSLAVLVATALEHAVPPPWVGNAA